MQTNRLNITRTLILVAIPLLALLAFLNRPGRISIEVDDGTGVFVATTKDAPFKQISTGSASRWFFKLPTDVYVMAKQNDKKTVTTIHLSRGQNKSTHLTLGGQAKATKVVDGAMMSPFFEGTDGQGIVYGENALTSFSITDRNAPVRTEFATLPYVSKVLWQNKNTFLYKEADGGVGQFINGVDNGVAQVGLNTSGDVDLNIDSSTEQGAPLIFDIDQAPGKPIVLMSRNNIFTSTNLGTTLRAITKFDTATNTDTQVFASTTAIYRIATLQSGSDSEGRAPTPTKIYKYSYTGKDLGSLEIQDNSGITRIVDKGSRTYILTKSSLYTVDNGVIHRQELYFGNPADMALYNNTVVVLANDGLWKLSDDGKLLQLLFEYPNHGTGLSGSMTITTENKLIFGTIPNDKDTKNTSATFITSF